MTQTLLSNLNRCTLLADALFPAGASTGADRVDSIFYFILAISVFFFVLITGLVAWFVIAYRERYGHREERTPNHNNKLEATWSLIPSAICVVIFFLGFTAFLDQRNPPEDAYEVQVDAAQWNWAFTYPNGAVSPDLHVPGDRDVKLVMTSTDVIHSLFVPAFRMKMDCVPGRYSYLWFNSPSPEGENAEPAVYDLFCAEYCGTSHSTMTANVVVHPSQASFEQWLEEANKLPENPVEAGKQVYQRKGCVQCHSIDGTVKTGPSFLKNYGTPRQTTTGKTITMDEGYVRESILNPMAEIRAGFVPAMPTYQGRIKEQEISALIWYLKSLAGEEVPETWPASEVPNEEGADGESAAGNAESEASDQTAQPPETPGDPETSTTSEPTGVQDLPVDGAGDAPNAAQPAADPANEAAPSEDDAAPDSDTATDGSQVEEPAADTQPEEAPADESTTPADEPASEEDNQ